MHLLCRTIILITSVLLAFPLAGQDRQSPDPLFQSFETLAVTITAPFTTLVKDRPKDDDLPGTFRLAQGAGPALEFDVGLSTRGHFRHENCDFPPVSLNFRRSQTAGTLFDKQDKLKLVVHCDDSSRYEQAVLREYLAYRILNAVTGYSFRVRLLHVTYIDSEARRDEQVRYAFLIEHKNRLGKRIDLSNLEIERTSVNSIDGAELNLASVFAFLIGNTDFSPVAGPPGDDCCHNYVLFQNEVGPIVAIPYDFDQSGLVDAPYAVPNDAFRIRNVRQRLYRGRCVNNVHIEQSLQKFRDARTDIYALVRDQQGMDSRVRKRVTGYIEDFYGLIDSANEVERILVNRCV